MKLIIRKRFVITILVILAVYFISGVIAWWYIYIKPESLRQWFEDRRVKKMLDATEAEYVKILKWLDTVSAKEQFKKDIASKRYVFFECSGFASTIPGVDSLDYHICYHRYAQIINIDGISDIVFGEEHENI